MYRFLSELPLYGLYENFYFHFSSDTHGSVTCDFYIPGTYENAVDILPLCRKIDKILQDHKYLDSTYDSVNIEKLCKYISYFSYEMLKNNSSYANDNILYEILKYSKSSYGLPDNCNITNFKIDKESFDKKKNIFFHSEILHWIKNKHKFSSNYSSEYNKYLQESADTYVKITNDEGCKYFQHCKNELQNFYKNFKGAKEYLMGKSIMITVDDIELPEKTKCSTQDVGVYSSGHRSQSLGSGEGVFPDGGRHHGQILRDNSNQDTGINSGVPLGIMGGTALLSLIFYKYTPLGPWLHSKIARGGEKMHLEEKINEIYLDTSENENINSYNDMYNIQYNSM
ncbi:PIR protein [Plasmodium ovale]|uniref:PIR protein n=1 Tax=Plasmodium ovale TaxID=36330 RepID=A0A1C3KHU8_PLAOA|nr:PIR protein [Plasmodium ovale]